MMSELQELKNRVKFLEDGIQNWIDIRMKGYSDGQYGKGFMKQLIMKSSLISDKAKDSLKKFLGDSGRDFFKHMKKEHGRLDAVYMDDGIPHCVHLEEGMQVRNFLRSLDECEDWDAHKLDDNWVQIVEGLLLNE